MKLMKWHYSCFYNRVCFPCVVFHCIEGSEVNITLWPCVIIREIVRGSAPEPDGPEFRNLRWSQNCSMLPTEPEQPTRKLPDRSCLSFTRAHKLTQAQKQTLTRPSAADSVSNEHVCCLTHSRWCDPRATWMLNKCFAFLKWTLYIHTHEEAHYHHLTITDPLINASTFNMAGFIQCGHSILT